jgi:serine/threonine protein kinase
MTDPAVADQEACLLTAAQAYQAALEAGRRPDRQAFLAQWPEQANALADYLDALDALHAGAASDCIPLGTALAPDSTLGDYRIVREIGRGGMGVVYEAVQLSLGRRVALKILPLFCALDERQLARFKNEAQAAAQLHHTNIVPVFGVGSERGIHFYAMQLIQGRTLAELIASLRDAPGPSARPSGDTAVALETPLASSATVGQGEHFRRVAGLMLQAALALEHAHQRGVIHRDIKPANLMVDAHSQLWITDFGLAQFQAGPDLTRTGDLVGTLRYASPEQSTGQHYLDHRVDLYSLGATFYELLTLQPVFTATCRAQLLRQIAECEPRLLSQFDRAIPVELETIVLKCLAKVPAERYGSARDLADDLERFLSNRPILARRPSLLERTRKWLRRHPGVAVATTLALVVCTSGLLVNQALLGREQARTREALRREERRAEQAERRLQQTRQLVNLLIELSEEDLDTRPLKGLRRRLLETALAHSQELIDDSDDGAADLTATRERLKQALADLNALQSADAALLLQSPAVLNALEPTDAQREQLNKLISRAGRGWAAVFFSRRLTLAQKKQRHLEDARASEQALGNLLRPAQLTRLRQIALQLRGLYAFRDTEVAAALALTPGQRQRVREIEAEVLVPCFRLQGKQFGWNEYGKRFREAVKRCVALLTPDQKVKWVNLTGKPFTDPHPFFGPPPYGPHRTPMPKAGTHARSAPQSRNRKR